MDKSAEISLGIAFFIWIFLLAFIDIALISLMLQNRVSEGLIIFISLIKMAMFQMQKWLEVGNKINFT